LVEGTPQGGDRRTVALAIDRDGHSTGPLRPTLGQLPWHSTWQVASRSRVSFLASFISYVLHL
jgi:hypothetical protein